MPARHARTVMYDSIPQVDGDAASDDMAAALGVERYLMIYQQNVGHPAASGNTINVQVVAGNIDAAVASAPPGITHACLDFENPFFESLNNLRLDPNNADGVQARQSLIDLVTECKSRHPNLKWGYYGVPTHRSNFIANQTVGTLATNPETLYTASGMTMTGSAWIQSRIEERYAIDGPICNACDYLAPTGYDRYPPVAYPGSTTRGNPDNAPLTDPQLLGVMYDVPGINPSWAAGTNQYHLRYSLLMGLCRHYRQQLGRPRMPVYPFVTMHYEKISTPPDPGRRWMPRRIPLDEFIKNQVRPYIDGGADSVMWWTAYDYYIDRSFDASLPIEEAQQFTDFVDQYREAYVLDYPEAFGLTSPDSLAWKSVDWTNTTHRDNLKRAVRDAQLNYLGDVSRTVRLYGAARQSTLNQYI